MYNYSIIVCLITINLMSINYMEKKEKTSSVVIIISLIAIVLSVMALRSKSEVLSPESVLDKVQRTGKIVACTVVDPPGVIKDAKTGVFSGHQIDAFNLIAKKINVAVEWHESTFGNAAAELQSKRCDIVVTDFFANVPRSAAVAFTRPPLFYIGESAIVRKDGVFTKINNIYEFDKPNITIAVATGESGDIFVRENFTKAKVRRIDVESADLSRFEVEVSSGRADVAIADSNTIRLYAEKHPEVLNLFKDNPFGLNPVGWAVRQDDWRWKDFVETSLQFLETQGILIQLENKYDAHWLHEIKKFEIN